MTLRDDLRARYKTPQRPVVSEEVKDQASRLRDLLSPDMRLREIGSSGAPYKWIVEARASEEWRCEGETGLLFFNYFGRRSEHIFQRISNFRDDSLANPRCAAYSR